MFFFLTCCELPLRSALTFSTSALKKVVVDLGKRETPSSSKIGRNMGNHADKAKGGKNDKLKVPRYALFQIHTFIKGVY